MQVDLSDYEREKIYKALCQLLQTLELGDVWQLVVAAGIADIPYPSFTKKQKKHEGLKQRAVSHYFRYELDTRWGNIREEFDDGSVYVYSGQVMSKDEQVPFLRKLVGVLFGFKNGKMKIDVERILQEIGFCFKEDEFCYIDSEEQRFWELKTIQMVNAREEQRRQKEEDERRREEEERRRRDQIAIELAQRKKAAEERAELWSQQKETETFRRWSGQCTMCGRPLGRFDKLTKRDRHKNCTQFLSG